MAARSGSFILELARRPRRVLGRDVMIRGVHVIWWVNPEADPLGSCRSWPERAKFRRRQWQWDEGDQGLSVQGGAPFCFLPGLQGRRSD